MWKERERERTIERDRDRREEKRKSAYVCEFASHHHRKPSSSS